MATLWAAWRCCGVARQTSSRRSLIHLTIAGSRCEKKLLWPVHDSGSHRGSLLFPRVVVLLLGNPLHPVNDLAVELFLDGDVRHGRGWRGAMPMLLAGRARDHVARSTDPDRPTPALHQSTARRDDERLTKGMRVPVTACAGLERDVGTARAGGTRRLEERVDAYGAREILGWPSSRRLRSIALEFHGSLHLDTGRLDERRPATGLFRDEFAESLRRPAADFVAGPDNLLAHLRQRERAVV